MTNELDKAAVEKAKDAYVEIWANGGFDKNLGSTLCLQLEKASLEAAIQAYLDETKLREEIREVNYDMENKLGKEIEELTEKLKAAEEALEYASQINSNFLAEEYSAALESSNAVIDKALKQIRS